MRKNPTRHNGPAIRAMRIRAGHKPGAFANSVGISYPHLDNIENERKQASLEVLYRIPDALAVPIEAILRDPAALVTTQRRNGDAA